jgi:tetratricopeptide (TPR) repeat protein
MQGGNPKHTIVSGATRIAEVALSALLMASTSYADLNFPASGAAEQPAVVAVAQKSKGERSILVAKGTISEESAKAPVKPRTRRRLEPISKISEYEPELAEPTIAPAQPARIESAPIAIEVAAPPVVEEPIVEAEAEPVVEPVIEATEQPNEPLVAEHTALEAVTFHGITPGISTRSEVLSDWTAPTNGDTNAKILSFQFEGLKSVDVNFAGERVKSITITLDKPTPISEMIASMQLEGIRSVIVSDAAKTHFNQAYPERGVILTLSDSAGMVMATDGQSTDVEEQVSGVLLESISSRLFLLRAKESAKSNLTQTIADLEQVVTLERKSAEAKYLLSCHNLAVGKAVTAERYAAEAVEIAPNDHEYRLQWAKCLGQLARYDRAVAEARKVLELPGVEPLQRAAALEEMGQLASLGSSEVAERSIQLHSKAIEIADGLANSEDVATRHAAQCVLIDAHLAIATQIAQGNFQDKNQAVPQWIERASALAEALIDEDASFLPRRLQVAVSALAAATNLAKPINPKLWVEEAEETVKILLEETPDVLTCSQYDWELGLAYLHAADIEHLRSDAESAKKFGKLAEEKLSELSRQRDELPDTGYTMGRLYFQIGAVFAVHEEDHSAACKWYDQAVDLLLNPVPVTTLAVPQQHGDALVSMGVSYWRTNDRERAVELTLAGVELIEEAVDAGLLGSTSLSVPYENLSAMYQALGKSEPAARYQVLARKVNGSLTDSPQ